MNKLVGVVAVILVAAPFVTGQPCGPTNGTITIAGSQTVQPITQAWATEYMKKCPSVTIIVEGGGTLVGARRVCGDMASGTPVDMGAMSRSWRTTEAISIRDNARQDSSSSSRCICGDGSIGTRIGAVSRISTDDTGNYQFVVGDKSRKTIQIEVGIDAVAVAVKTGSLAAQCMQKAGGLTMAQLRWMYSNISEAGQGLGTTVPFNQVIPNSDGNEVSKKWNELNALCPDTNIRIAGHDSNSATYEFFRQALGFVIGEDFATNRPGGYFNSEKDDDILKYVNASSFDGNGDAVAFFDLWYYREKRSLLYGVPIRNTAGVYTAPTTTNIQTNAYNPLSRRLYLQVLNNDTSLAKTKPFLAWGFSDSGTRLLHSATRFVALPEEQRTTMLARLDLPPSGNALVLPTGLECGPANGTIAMAGSQYVEPIARVWATEYKKRCPTIRWTLGGGDSSMGAGRACGQNSSGTPVDIGIMDRKWLSTEVTSSDGNVNSQCLIGDANRKTIQIEVGIDGVAVALAIGGLATQCLRPTSGLTVAQLRWMYSNISEAGQGLGTSIPINEVIPNSDGNETSKHWSELNALCPEANIRIAGADALSENNVLFRQALGFVAGEGFATNRPGGYFNSTKDEDIAKYVETSSLEYYGDAIGYVGLSFYLERGSLFYGVPIRNAAGVYTAPTKADIGSYNPLSRRLYVQVLNNDASLASTKPFLAWGLSNTGSALVYSSTRFVDVPLDQRTTMLARLALPPPIDPAPTPAPICDCGGIYEPIFVVPKACGLFKLNFLCLTGCGFLGRRLGLCPYE